MNDLTVNLQDSFVTLSPSKKLELAYLETLKERDEYPLNQCKKMMNHIDDAKGVHEVSDTSSASSWSDPLTRMDDSTLFEFLHEGHDDIPCCKGTPRCRQLKKVPTGDGYKDFTGSRDLFQESLERLTQSSSTSYVSEKKPFMDLTWTVQSAMNAIHHCDMLDLAYETNIWETNIQDDSSGVLRGKSILLTLTSFPFRIVHGTAAAVSIIGASLMEYVCPSTQKRFLSLTPYDIIEDCAIPCSTVTPIIVPVVQANETMGDTVIYYALLFCQNMHRTNIFPTPT